MMEVATHRQQGEAKVHEGEYKRFTHSTTNADAKKYHNVATADTGTSFVVGAAATFLVEFYGAVKKRNPSVVLLV